MTTRQYDRVCCKNAILPLRRRVHRDDNDVKHCALSGCAVSFCGAVTRVICGGFFADFQ